MPPKKSKAKAVAPAAPVVSKGSPIEIPLTSTELFSYAATQRPFKNPSAEYLATKSATQRKAKAVKNMLLAERDRELQEVSRLKKLKKKADAEAAAKQKESDAMDVDEAKNVPITNATNSIPAGDTLICYSTIEAPPSLLPTPKYCDITGLEAPYTDPQTSLRYHDRNVFAHVRTLKPAAVQSHLALRGGGQPVIV